MPVLKQHYSIGRVATPKSCVVTGLAYSATTTIDEGAGHAFIGAIIGQNPTNHLEVVTLVLSGGNSQAYAADINIVYYKSTNGGVTRGTKTSIVAPSGANIPYDFCSGYDSSGRYHLIYTMRDASLAVVGTYSIYSDDSLATWSAPTSITLPSDGLSTGDFINGLIDNDGVLMGCYYRLTSGTTFPSAQYIVRCTNPSATSPTWSFVQAGYDATHYVNESSVVALDSTHLLMISRTEYSPYEFRQYRSNADNGATGTWTDDGLTDFYSPNLTVNAGPPVLKSFTMEGVKVIVAYFLDKGAAKIYAEYALASDLIANGLTAWKSASRITIVTGTAGISYHYGDVLHFNDNFNAVACFTHELTTPWTYTHNTIVFQNIQSTNYATVKSALGI